MEIFRDKTWYGKEDVFEVVNEYPSGYVVWNIGRANFPHECYVPLAKPKGDPYHIDPDSLKAIKVKDEETALKILKYASCHGCDEKTFKELTA